MELHRRPSSSTGFHSERVSSPICRRADSFADLDTLHHRAPAVFAPKPLKPRRTFSSMATHNTTFAPVLSAPTSSVASPTAGIAMRRMLSVDDEHFMAYEELHDILFSSGESDLESSSSDGGLVLSRSSYSPASSTASPIEIGRSSARANEAFFQATPPSRAPNPCAQNHVFHADGTERGRVVSPSSPSLTIANEHRFQQAY